MHIDQNTQVQAPNDSDLHNSALKAFSESVNNNSEMKIENIDSINNDPKQTNINMDKIMNESGK